ncbi:MAG TPA: ATP-binding cassette domain-containing protein [Castellaniella sp.]|nr:ATP-binding cassette domain-containing protein [Castellaniella sp.]
MKEQDDTAYARGEVLRLIGGVLWDQRWRTALALVLLVAAKLFMVAVPVALKRIVDTLGAPADVVLPVFLLLGYTLLRFAGSLGTEIRDVVFSPVAQKAVVRFTLRVFGHLQSLGARFHGARRTGSMARDLDRGTAGVSFLVGTALFTLLPTVVEIVTVVGILVLNYDLSFAGVVAATFVVYAAHTSTQIRRRVPLQRYLNELDSQASGKVVDSLLNYEAVKLNGTEAGETERLGGVLSQRMTAAVRNQNSLSLLHVGQAGIIAVGLGAVMLLAGQHVAVGRMTVGDLVLINAYMIQICLPLNTLGLIVRQSREAFIAAERVCALLRLPPEPGAEASLPALAAGPGEVVFEGVSFGYEPGRRILHEVDLRIPAGSTLAVVGGSGSGKSTLARLLLRFYDPDEGRVLVDGQDVRRVSVASLRRRLGIVPQDTQLFNDTIAYNIGYSRPGATRDDIRQAAAAARIHDFIEGLPAGYDTPVGERGLKLSGGERQRIAIARALLKQPSIMIFDEATSALDTRTERAIQQELDRIARDHTTLIIAHRLSTIVDADRIVVLDRGRVAESGTHEELLARGAVYAQMWQLQRQMSALETAGGETDRLPVNLVTLVAGVLDASRDMQRARGVNLYTFIGAEAARITGDPSALQRLIWDLHLRALAFTPPGGRMALRLARDGPVTRLSITDGRALPEAAADQEPPDDPALARAAALDPAALAADIQRQGGHFAETREADGAMTASVEFPLRAVADQQMATAVPAASADLTGLTVMLVDDHDEARDMLSAVLQDGGARTEVYSGGREALDALTERPFAQWPDVLVCDISLGDMDGDEVIAQLRARESEARIALSAQLPAIALSGHSSPEYRLRALLAGFQLHLSKPVDSRELLVNVALLAHSRRPAAGSPPLAR